MPNVPGQGNTFNLPNYAGELFTADAENTPFLSAIGGMTGGLQTQNFEFATSSLYEYPAASQPGISEQASVTAPQAISYVRNQNTNVTQIFHESVSLTYAKQSNSGRLSGLNTQGQTNNAPSEKDFQIARQLGKIARDVEWSFINGEYQKATTASEANKTRGMYEAAGTAIDAAGADLKRDILQNLWREMYTNGAVFSNVVLWTNAYLKQIITDLYSYAPTDRNVGGVNIKQIETDFGNIGIMLNRFNPTSGILVAEMSVVAPVFQPVPGKGNFFYEELSKKGAADEGQIFGQIGLDHGPAFMHGKIENLATA
ncbi:DUF5309 family protein [Paenibacillus sp. FSL W7-1279]|uniref:SU10 major capsid protein n=1 Tax=Paenibacillus sp. FSL W7-1279 TaxID=2921697 RepID=UPI0030DBB0A6